MLNGPQVELPAMLAARERRAASQQAFLEKYHSPLLSFCLNIPGPVKTTPELRLLFDQTCHDIQICLRKLGITIADSQTIHEATGDEYLLAFTGDAAVVKTAMTQLEESRPLGRLFDIDILTAEGQKLSRPVPRRCLLCDRQAQDCARSRRHSVRELTDRIETLLQEYMH
jgi:holo-ACP synthase CitX